MFDIGFWEIAVVAVVALLVVGPQEFPALVRSVGTWVGRIRHFVSEAKADLDREVSKAEELKRLLAKEAELAELHKDIDLGKPAVAVNSKPKVTAKVDGVQEGAHIEPTSDQERPSPDKQRHGAP